MEIFQIFGSFNHFRKMKWKRLPIITFLFNVSKVLIVEVFDKLTELIFGYVARILHHRIVFLSKFFWMFILCDGTLWNRGYGE